MKPHVFSLAIRITFSAKTVQTALRIPLPPIVLVNLHQVEELFYVDHIDVGCTFFHKNGCSNTEKSVTPQSISMMVLNLHINTINILSPIQMVFIKFFKKNNLA